jgi:multidrug efflux pump subunit AcrA (membrane-fusion protein)
MEGNTGVNDRILVKLLLTVILSAWAVSPGNSFAVNENRAQPVPVRVVEAVKKDINQTLSTMGTITYLAKADVSAEIEGLLRSVDVEEGDNVQKNQAIAVIDSALLEAKLHQAQARLEMMQIELARSEMEVNKARYRLNAAKVTMEKTKEQLEAWKQLFESGGMSKTERDAAEVRYANSVADYQSAIEDLRSLQVKSKSGRIEREAMLRKAQADVDEIEIRLKKCTIRAPITGTVASKRKWPGERINPTDTVIVTIIDTRKVFAVIDLSEKDIGLVHRGQQAEIRADAFPNISFTGRVEIIRPTVDMDSRTVKVKVGVANDDQLLKPGMFVRVKIILESMKDVVTIPREALITTKDGRNIVFVVLEEVAFMRDVEIASAKEGQIVIRTGVNPGEKVVIEGQERIKDLTSVQSTEIERQ